MRPLVSKMMLLCVDFRQYSKAKAPIPGTFIHSLRE
jgi:hypothetical protein